MSFGSGLGGVIGGVLADQDLQQGQSRITDTTNSFNTSTQPFVNFGQSFLPTTADAIGGIQAKAGETQGYDQFMKGYTNTPAAQYQLQQADAVQNNSAAARGGVLSGSNNRALATINNGIVSQNANTAYNEYLAGNNQQFGQLESALGNMFKAIGVGTTGTGQQGAVAGANMAQTSALAQASAKNEQAKGAGIGSMFDGIGGMFAAF